MSAAVTPRRDAPVYTLKLYVRGQPPASADDVTDRVLRAEFDDDDAKADQLSLTLDNFDLAIFDDSRWRKGNYLQFTWGYAGAPAPTRTLVIQSIKGSLNLSVVALSQGVLMNKKKRSRLFENMTRSDIVVQIAQEYGYGTQAAFIDDTEVVLPSVTQANLTDAQFLASLAKREGFEFYVDFEGLHWKRRDLTKKPIRQLVYFVDGTGSILGFNVENDVTLVPGSVNAKGRDPLAKKDIDVTASDSDTKRDGLADEMEVVDPRTETTQTVAVAAGTTYNTNAKTADEAKREADGRFIKSQHAVVIMTMDLAGDPGISAKQIVQCAFPCQRLSGNYYVKNAKHTLSGTEYRTSITVRSDGSNNKNTGVAKSSAAQNDQPPADPNALVPVEVVDPRTKETTVVYRPAGASAP